MPKRPAPMRKSERDVRRAIARAETILPGTPAPEGQLDPRWQAIIRVSEFIESEPEIAWEFSLRWARRARNFDLGAAVGCCLLEELLGDRFDQFFPRMREAALSSKRFARSFEMCSHFAREDSPNGRKVRRLFADMRRKYG